MSRLQKQLNQHDHLLEIVNIRYLILRILEKVHNYIVRTFLFFMQSFRKPSMAIGYPLTYQTVVRHLW